MTSPGGTRAPFVFLALVCLGLAAFVLVRRPVTSMVSPAALPEMHRTNLVSVAGRWQVPGQTNGFTGFIVDTYDSGATRSRSALSNGVLQGVSMGWYTNGQQQVEEHFVAGSSEGTRVKWYANGQKQSEGTIVQGKFEGAFRRWDEQGHLSEQAEFKNGLPDGVSSSFYPSGCIKTQITMKDGKIVDQKSWPDGERRP